MSCCSACGAPGAVTPGAPCGPCGAIVDPVTGAVVPAPGVCAPGPANVPITDEEYANSLGVCLQDAVDSARKIQHDLGLRPYRVRLVWWERDGRQRFTKIYRELELTPVQVSTFNDLDWELTEAGMQDQGDLLLSEISPVQVDQATLLGKIDGADPPPGVEFFYEVQQIGRCVGTPPINPGRFTPTAIPYLDGEQFQYFMVIGSQNHPRAAAPGPDTPDRDNTFKPARLRRRRRGTLRT